jgi:hypothetical protein
VDPANFREVVLPQAFQYADERASVVKALGL